MYADVVHALALSDQRHLIDSLGGVEQVIARGGSGSVLRQVLQPLLQSQKMANNSGV